MRSAERFDNLIWRYYKISATGGVLGSTGAVEVQGACRVLLTRKTGRDTISADDYNYAMAA